MERNYDRKIVLEDGIEFYGYGFGGDRDRVCEIIFNSSMVGYQEIISSPSYTYQMVVMTYPIIGSCGIADDDFETKIPSIGGLVVREYNDRPSNFRYTKTLSEIMEENHIPGISGVDTRMLSCHIRSHGTMKALITSADKPKKDAMAIIAASQIPKDGVSKVSCRKKWYSRTSNHSYNIAAIDCGIRQSIIKSLNKRGCNLTVLPYNVTAEEIEALKPDGIYISDGPGNPEDLQNVIETIRALRSKYIICGDGLGFLLLCLAFGGKTTKMKYGSYGSNHPVRCTKSGKIDIKSENHGYIVDKKSLEGTGLTITHTDVLDESVQGVESLEDKVRGVQFYPLSVSDPEAGDGMFDKFFAEIDEVNANA
ncbi:MAG: glutamine-hydrolyzing carbamoyl-phosphate synthase small subunit [Oscillospiraceae bacterium]